MRGWRIGAAVAATAAIVGGLLWLAPVSEAASGSNCSYFSDPGHTTLVGRFGRDCCNNNVAWGVKTAFSECSSACLLCTPPAP